MAKFISKGDSVEGELLLVNARKPVLQAIINRRGNTFCKYKCEINCKAEVIKELKPKKAVIKITSNLNLGDFLEADKIEILTRNRMNFQKEANYSSSHGIQTASSKGFAFAEIFIPFRWVLERALSAPRAG